ncbi:MAG: serine hydrolase [Bdellovibrionaceae bacterium]|nr:serine hydrolase [Pseudobdellovibrionaceae bacterium]
MKPFFEIDYYHDYIPPSLAEHLLKNAQSVHGIQGLKEVGNSKGLETADSLKFLSELYLAIKNDLRKILQQRRIDRKFIDERTRACAEFNSSLQQEITDPDYKTIIGLEDHEGRVVLGPLQPEFMTPKIDAPIAAIPEYLQGPHVTLFGPPDSAKMAINAMNSYHRKIKNEPKIVEELLQAVTYNPKWGADDEDSKTPIHADLLDAGINLTACFEGKLRVDENLKTYELEKEHLATPIKRFPGLALPCTFLFQDDNPIPLHLYDFALHLFRNWNINQALCFYIPKLENEEEATYIAKMISTAEKMIQQRFSSYKLGSVRLMVVLENPRAILRTNEIIDNLYPYFVGASLGWHDFLASTARIFKEDSHYRIPVKADPNIVIKYIKASHHLLADVVGGRGGVKVGGMYGILPLDSDPYSPSFQMTLVGFFKDVITQMKRDLSGFWVAHPDFVRLGIALVEGWRQHRNGQSGGLEELVKQLLLPEHHSAILNFIHGPDIEGLKSTDKNFVRSLIVADIKESDFIANNHPEEIRYNVFQSLQYLTDWLCGNGCVALPAHVNGVSVRVMDDLATAERSRWEVWHELYHGRFPIDEFIKIVHQEMHFIRKDLSRPDKLVQVKYTNDTAKWYPIALKIMLQLMTDKNPVEFASELLLPFTIESIRKSEDPWKTVNELTPRHYQLPKHVERLNYYFEACGSLNFAKTMARGPILDLDLAKKTILGFSLDELLESASFHGDIGEAKKTLDAQAASEQQNVFGSDEVTRQELLDLGNQYKKKFGFKFLVSAKNKTAQELLTILKNRLQQSRDQEMTAAREALWDITHKRLTGNPSDNFKNAVTQLLTGHKITGASIAINSDNETQALSFGHACLGQDVVQDNTLFEIASLSKPIASAFCLEYFKDKNIPLETSVNSLLAKAGSSFRLSSDAVQIEHLLNHTALSGHYVNGYPLDQSIPEWPQILKDISVINKPGTQFSYSGGGFLVLEYLIECLEKKSISDITTTFFKKLGLSNLTFQQKNIPGKHYATGYFDEQKEVPSSRLIFPAFAAGAMGSAQDMAMFLNSLTRAYQDIQGCGPISHDTAMTMLHGKDKGSVEFMGTRMGLGVFIAEAGENKIAVHQGANEGFRALFLHCFVGPDQGKGFVIFANGDNAAIAFIAEIAQMLLKTLGFSGVRTEMFRSQFDFQQVAQEQIVNRGYKNLIFDAFQPCRPDPIFEKGPKDPLAPFNLAVDAKILSVTAERFARAENLLSSFEPVFDPQLFCAQGKVMDSWESERHNEALLHTMEFEMRKAGPIRYIQVSTKYHDGNQVESIEIFGYDSQKNIWDLLLPKKTLVGHGLLQVKQDALLSEKSYKKIKVHVFPDGGLSRLGLYSELPANTSVHFKKWDEACSIRFNEVIPKSHKPLTITYNPTPTEITKNIARLNQNGKPINQASAAFGGSVVSVSNQHYGPVAQVISPFPPIHMFDGFESARSRTPGHFEEIVLKLGQALPIQSVIFDFKYFVNNNPSAISIDALKDGQWLELAPKTAVKAFAGNRKEFRIQTKHKFDQIRVKVYPDGGIHRVLVY